VVRHLGRVAVAISGLAFASTVLYALMFLLVFKRVVTPQFFVDYGLILGCVPLALIVATYLLRLGAGRWMLAAGDMREAYDYAYPRRRSGVTIGRTEAAVNRYVAAEATRCMGRPEQALEILDEEYAVPWRPAVRAMLARARDETVQSLEAQQ